jgi:hypothetical protein
MGFLQWRRLTKSLTETDISNHVECITLEPVPKIENLLSIRKLVQPLEKYIDAAIHKGLVVHH